jgi:nucleoside-diphosphate-sugar epimerase
MKILISGIHGFIGSNLAIRLKNDGHEVDEIYTYDLSSVRRIIDTISYFNPDQIYNCASYGNHHDHYDGCMVKSANIDYPFNLMYAILNTNEKIILFNFSTSSVLLPNQTIYSATKRAAELICFAYAKKWNLDVRVIRPYSVYGPNDNKNHLIPKIIKNILCLLPMEIVPNATHDWIYIDDFIDSLLKGECNIGTGIKTKNIEIVKLLEKISGKKLRYNEVSNLRSYDNDNWVSKFAVKHRSLEEGLRLTYQYYEKLAFKE